MSRVRIHIEFVDGSKETSNVADDVRVRDGVLHAYDRRYNMGYSMTSDTHVGSWPLQNIKRYRTEPA